MQPSITADQAAERLAVFRAARRPRAGPRDDAAVGPRTSRSSAPAWSARPSPGRWPRTRWTGPGRRGRRRRHRHVQGEHRDPAHRVRRHAGQPGEPPAQPRAPGCCASTPRRRGSRSSAPARCSSPGRRTRSRRCPASRRTRGATGTTAIRPLTGRRALRARAARSGRARSAGSRSRTSASSARGPCRSPSPPRPSRAGVRLCCRHPGHRGRRGRRRRIELATTRGPVRCRWVVNAAGLGSDEVDRMFGGGGFTDPAAAGRAHRVRQAGPAAAPVDPAAGADGADQGGARRADGLRQRAARPHRRGRAGPRRYGHDRGRAAVAAGGRAADPARAGATRRSPRRTRGCGPPPSMPTTRSGWTPRGGTRARPASARPACPRRWASPSTSPACWSEAGLALKPRPGLAASPPVMPYIGEAGTRPYQDAAAIAADPAYGEIVCHCERVTRGEIRDALASPVPPARPGRAAPPDPGGERPLPGVLLRGRGVAAAGRRAGPRAGAGAGAGAP